MPQPRARPQRGRRHGPRRRQAAARGDTYSDEAAREVVRRLRFETGFYSRCWEISSAHLDAEAHRFLAELADIATPTLFLFVAFRIPYSPAIGVKLIATPGRMTTFARSKHHGQGLMQEHRRQGMPESLVDVLHLAAHSPTCACWCSMPMRRCWTDCRFYDE